MKYRRSKLCVRIENDGQPGHMTKVTNMETGEPIPHIQAVSLRIVVDGSNDLPKAVITTHGPRVDVVANATITHVCPYCQRSMDEDEGENKKEGTEVC